LAFFGDPETRGVREDALACVNMAVAMQRRMRELEIEWRGAGLEKPFQMRIGISTAFCTVGNFGSEDRMDYTIIGGGVNLAARLQANAMPGGILISHETWSLVRDGIVAEEQEPMQVKGLVRPIRSYRVLVDSPAAAASPVIREEKAGFKLFLDLQESDRAAVAEALEKVLSLIRR
jgi:class 3 adenylate cyclase